MNLEKMLHNCRVSEYIQYKIFLILNEILSDFVVKYSGGSLFWKLFFNLLKESLFRCKYLKYNQKFEVILILFKKIVAL